MVRKKSLTVYGETDPPILTRQSDLCDGSADSQSRSDTSAMYYEGKKRAHQSVNYLIYLCIILICE